MSTTTYMPRAGSLADEVCLFAVIGFPHADDAAGRAALRPGDNHHAPVQQAHRAETFFAIVPEAEPGSEIDALLNWLDWCGKRKRLDGVTFSSRRGVHGK